MMAAPRSSMRALRQITPASRRCLHITGVNSAQPANVEDKASLYGARTESDLKQECQRRTLASSGTKSELVERLSNNDVLQSRAFSIAMRRINGNAFSENANRNTRRQFNTSRSQKAVNDNSTVDFAYMPSMEELHMAAPHPGPRIPILPDAFNSPNPFLTTPDIGDSSLPPMKPQVFTVAGATSDVAASPMSEVVDNHSVDMDPFSLTETVGRSRIGAMLQQRASAVFGSRSTPSGEKGVARELWGEFLDDLMGPKQARK